MNSGSFRLVGDERERSAENLAGILACAGLLNALIAAVLFCRLPQSTAPSLVGLCARAAFYVLIAAAAGAAGSWLYWKRFFHPAKPGFPVTIGIFNLASVAAWAWVPAVVMLADESSPAAPVVAAVGASILGISLRRMIPLALHDVREDGSIVADKGLFAATLQMPAFRSHGYAIAICVYTAAFALHDRSIATASALLASCAFLFAWEATLADGRTRRMATRLACVALSAIVVTVWALLDGVAHRGRSNDADVAFARGDNPSQRAANVANPGFGYGGFESIILWPVPQKKQIVPPLPVRTELLAPGTSRPVVIRFDGPYWYFQPPDTRPGPTAHQAHGTPLSAGIRSSNSFPLSMEAHQSLGSSIRLSRCREIQVQVENREDQPNAVAVAVLLTDSTAPGRPTLYLGQQVLRSTLPDRTVASSAPRLETLRFEVPAHAKIRRFNEINLMILPDVGPALVGPRIAVQQFQLLPR